MFLLDRMKLKRSWDIPFFICIKMKYSIWVLYKFKAAVDYGLLYRLFYFWSHNNIPKIFSREKLNLTWNEEINYSELCPFPQTKRFGTFQTPHLVKPHRSRWKFKVLQGPLKLFHIFLEGRENSMMLHTENLGALLI